MSANLPLMVPLVKWLRAQWTNYPSPTHTDEENSNILELAPVDLRSNSARSENPNPAAAPSSESWTTIQASKAKGGVHDFGLPEDRILVEMDLEQNVKGL